MTIPEHKSKKNENDANDTPYASSAITDNCAIVEEATAPTTALVELPDPLDGVVAPRHPHVGTDDDTEDMTSSRRRTGAREGPEQATPIRIPVTEPPIDLDEPTAPVPIATMQSMDHHAETASFVHDVHVRQDSETVTRDDTSLPTGSASSPIPQEQLPVAVPITGTEAEPAQEDPNRDPIAVATQVDPSTCWTKYRTRLIVFILFICGAIAGIAYAIVSVVNSSSTSSSEPSLSSEVSYSPSPTVHHSQAPTISPTVMVLEQIGQSLFEDSNHSVTGHRGQHYFGWSVDLSSDGQRLAATSPYSSSVYIYDLIGDFWRKTGTISDVSGGLVDTLAISGDGNALAVGMPGNSQLHDFGGKVQVYVTASGSWRRQGDPVFGLSPNDRIGGFVDDDSPWEKNDELFSTDSYDSSSLALSEDGFVLAIGSSRGNYVQVLVWDDHTDQWIPHGSNNVFFGEAAGNKFGTSVDLSADGKRVVIGGPSNIGEAEHFYDIFNGHVRVFQYVEEQNSWIQLGQDLDGTRGEEYRGEQAGSTVSISDDGSAVLVGANLQASSEDIYALGEYDGYAKVYKYSEVTSDWIQQGNTINVFQFGLSGLTWEEENAVSSGLGSEKFPIVVRLSGDGNIVAVSVLSESLSDVGGRGVVRLYMLQGERWQIIANPVEGTVLFDHSGRSISLSRDGSRLAIGAPQHNGVTPDDGQVRVFDMVGHQQLPKTTTRSPTTSPTISLSPTSVPVSITVLLTLDGSYGGAGWLLNCGGLVMANETVFDEANITKTFSVEDGCVCHLRFSKRQVLDLYKVYYGEDTNQDALIIVEGADLDRQDYIAFYVTPHPASITILLQLDGYKRETTWNLECDSISFATVPFGGYNFDADDFDLIEQNVTGIENGSFCEFTITDAFGDGMCCNHGIGFYMIYNGQDTTDTDTLLAKGGKFGSHQKINFTVSQSPRQSPSSYNGTTSPAPTPTMVALTVFLSGGYWSPGWRLFSYHTIYASFVQFENISGRNITETVFVESGTFCQLVFTDSCRGCFYQVYFGDRVSEGALLVEGADFGDHEMIVFAAKDPSLTESPSLQPTEIPSRSSVPTRSPFLVQEKVPITLMVRLDEDGSEAGWSLFCNHVALVTVSEGTFSDEPQNITKTFLVEDGSLCQLTIKECFYQIFYGDHASTGAPLIQGGKFRRFEKVTFKAEKLPVSPSAPASRSSLPVVTPVPTPT